MSEKFTPTTIYVERRCRDRPYTNSLLERMPQVPTEVVKDRRAVWEDLKKASDPINRGKEVLLIAVNRGPFLKRCPGTSGYICCNYRILNVSTYCPFECSYCILQDYLHNNPVNTIFANIDEALRECERAFLKSPGTLFRLGTGELTDSLVLDHITGHSRRLIPFMDRFPNVVLELKTKSNNISNLIDLEHKGRTVISWSLTPQSIIDEEEEGTSDLMERIEAAGDCANQGYRIGFHLDPIIISPEWEEAYLNIIIHIASSVDPSSIAWISMAGFRFTSALKAIINDRFPSSSVLLGELLVCPDKKYRYLRFLRTKVYKRMLEWFREYLPDAPVYMCMESPIVWQDVFGATPENIPSLKEVFGKYCIE